MSFTALLLQLRYRLGLAGRWASGSPALVRAVLMASAVALVGCAPKIGDHCLVSSDCASNGSRVCDTSQPDGYCTIFNCSNGSCPNNAACVTLMPGVPGCSYDDYDTPSRSSRTLCLATCNSDSDCRTDNGYICANPRGSPWNALILDNNQGEQVCIVAPVAGYSNADGGFSDAAICSPGPAVSVADAMSSASDGALVDVQAPSDAEGSDVLASMDVQASMDVAQSASVDATLDAPPEAEATPLDGALDSSLGPGFDGATDDAGLDAAAALLDAAPDAVADASGGD